MAYISKAVLPPVIEAIEKKLAEHAVPRPSDDGLKLDLTEARLYCDKLLHRLRLYEAEFDKRGIPHPLGSSSENILDSLTDELGGPETYATHLYVQTALHTNAPSGNGAHACPSTHSQGTLGQLRTQARQLRVESNCWAREWAYYFYVTEALWKMIEDGEVRLAAPWRTEMAEIEVSSSKSPLAGQHASED